MLETEVVPRRGSIQIPTQNIPDMLLPPNLPRSLLGRLGGSNISATYRRGGKINVWKCLKKYYVKKINKLPEHSDLRGQKANYFFKTDHVIQINKNTLSFHKKSKYAHALCMYTALKKTI